MPNNKQYHHAPDRLHLLYGQLSPCSFLELQNPKPKTRTYKNTIMELTIKDIFSKFSETKSTGWGTFSSTLTMSVVAVLALLTGVEAKADTYGCQVMLCMSNPKGPRAEQTCQPPIDRLLRERAKARPPSWPTCDEAKPTTMVFTSRLYDDCPAGTSTLGSDMTATQFDLPTWTLLVNNMYVESVKTSAPARRPLPIEVNPAKLYDAYYSGQTMPAGRFANIGIGEGNGTTDSATKVCVAGPLGKIHLTGGSANGENTGEIVSDVYQTVVLVDRASNPRVADIYIDGKLYKSTRF